MGIPTVAASTTVQPIETTSVNQANTNAAENTAVKSTEVRSQDGGLFKIVAYVREKISGSSHHSLAARVNIPAEGRETQSVLTRIKAFFTGSSRASQAETAPAAAGATKQLVNTKTAQFTENNKSLATSVENIKERAETHVRPAAHHAVKELLSAGVCGNGDVFEIKAEVGINEAFDRLDAKIAENPDDIKGVAKASKALNKDIQKEVISAYKLAASAEGTTLSKSDIKTLKKEFQQHMSAHITQSLNKTEANWQTTTETVKLDVATQRELGASGDATLTERSFTATTTPAAKLEVLAGGYQADEKHGISSTATSETDHAVNLWVSELKGETTSYAAVRHGVNFPFGVKHDAELATKGADTRTQEVVTAAASTKAADIVAWRTDHPGEPFPLKIVSTSLLTAASKAKTYETGQQEAWGRAQGEQTITVDLPGEGITEVNVEVEVLPFSMGVNGFAKLGLFSGSIGKHLGDRLTGWKWADNHNEPLIGKLDEMVEQAKADAIGANDPGKVARLESYSTQLHEAVNDGKQRRSAGNAYGVAVLVNLIANETGAVPAINCMSGKDRTGYLDAAVKARLMEVESLNAGRPQNDKSIVPQIYGQRTEAQNALMSLSSEVMGGKTVQKACTGVAGYKVGEGGMFKVQANLDNVLDSKSLLGLSAAVKA
ncbi:Inositol phosphate phosphatase IpgD [Pseudovibrio sp. Ad13]|uniref:inositol phosphate phosphatase SopB n=1 Tax=Pseudovibrio sp. Ad13 TaxID=989396 RepID=UPI0007AE70C6|nr:inositol phosphate phosphatase SopB [Pseudovibrio sp. Ad13]KZK82696.1 Inositol phosphate phosphatase IpgD [Pseudovibrio sp. Ad13]